jgi:hypothetical protein
MECNGLCLDLAFLHINLVAAKDDGNILAHSNKIACIGSVKLKPMPWDIRCQFGTFL